MTDDDVAQIAARATLLALRSSLVNPEAVHGDRIAVLPEMRPLALDDASEWLAHMPKPLSCIAAEARGLMAVGAWPVQRSVDTWQEFDDMLDAVFQECAASQRTASPAAEVVVRGVNEATFGLTFAQCKQWLADYEFPLLDFNIAPATERQRDDSALCVVTFFRSAGGMLDI